MDLIGNITREICLQQNVVLIMVLLIVFPFELLLYKHRTGEAVTLWKDIVRSPLRWLRYTANLFKVEDNEI